MPKDYPLTTSGAAVLGSEEQEKETPKEVMAGIYEERHLLMALSVFGSKILEEEEYFLEGGAINFQGIYQKMKDGLWLLYENNRWEEFQNESENEPRYSIGTRFRSLFGSYVNSFLVRLLLIYLYSPGFDQRKFLNSALRRVEVQLISEIRNQNRREENKLLGSDFIFYQLVKEIYNYAKSLFLREGMSLGALKKKLTLSRFLKEKEYSEVESIIKNQYGIEGSENNCDLSKYVTPEELLLAAVIYRIFERNISGICTEFYFLQFIFDFFNKEKDRMSSAGLEGFLVMQGFEDPTVPVNETNQQYMQFQEDMISKISDKYIKLSCHEDTVLGIDYLIQPIINSRKLTIAGKPLEFFLIQIKSLAGIEGSNIQFIYPLQTKEDLSALKNDLDGLLNLNKKNITEKKINAIKLSVERMMRLTLLEQYRYSIPVVVILPTLESFEFINQISGKLSERFNSLLSLEIKTSQENEV